MDFLADDSKADFFLEWNAQAFEEGQQGLEEGESYPYPRY